jgi:dTDP-4-amino-4,6-dideoxygalactose transaminase
MQRKKMKSWPLYTEEEAEAVKQVLLSNKVNYWTGEECRKFEEEFAAYCNCKYGVALANGTVAIDLALKSLGIGPGHEVIVTPRTFLASASCVVNAGAIPVFADVDLVSQNITAETIEKVITEKTRAIICVHVTGWACEMDGIMNLAKEYNLNVIEDCAHAHGAKYKGIPVGSFGDVAAWSFCQDKIMTTGGEGGMLTTNNKEIWESAWSYKDHGKSWKAVYKKDHPPGFKWYHEDFGTNWRMTEMQAVLGRIQLKRLDSWVEQRRKNACFLNESFKEIDGIRVTIPPEHIYHSYYKYFIFVEPERFRLRWDRHRMMMEILKHDIHCMSGGVCPEVYLEKAFEKHGLMPENRLENAKELGETSLMFLVHPTLYEDDMAVVADVVKSVAEKAFK